jgi:glycerol uptake facilitator protein
MGIWDKIKENLEIKPLILEAVCVTLIVFYGGLGWAYEGYATYQAANGKLPEGTKQPREEYQKLEFLSINTSMICNGCINFFLMSVLTWVAAPISGGHLNPAVTVGYIITKNMQLFKRLLYIVAQLGGSVAGAFLYSLVVPGYIKSVAEYTNVNTGLPEQHSAFGYRSMVIQFLGAFCLMFIFYALRIEKKGGNKSSFGVAIGALTAASVMCFGEFTHHSGGKTTKTDKLHGVSVNSNLNPARVFGPMFFEFKLGGFLNSVFGPILGAATAALVYKWFLHRKEIEEDDDEMMIEIE